MSAPAIIALLMAVAVAAGAAIVVLIADLREERRHSGRLAEAMRRRDGWR
ncbi:MAG: hypothetical protein WAU78_12800 [Roseiarcus sp.]